MKGVGRAREASEAGETAESYKLKSGERANVYIEERAAEIIAVGYLTIDPTSIAPVVTRLSLTATPFSSFSFNSFFFARLLSPPLVMNVDKVSRVQKDEVGMLMRGASFRSEADDIVDILEGFIR
jgi:hypothetical protein